MNPYENLNEIEEEENEEDDELLYEDDLILDDDEDEYYDELVPFEGQDDLLDENFREGNVYNYSGNKK